MKDLRIHDKVHHAAQGNGTIKWIGPFGAWVRWDEGGWMSIDVPLCDLSKAGSIGTDAWLNYPAASRQTPLGAPLTGAPRSPALTRSACVRR